MRPVEELAQRLEEGFGCLVAGVVVGRQLDELRARDAAGRQAAVLGRDRAVTAPAAVRELLNLPGKRYLPETVAEATGNSFVRSALSKGSLFISVLAAGGTNLYDYGLGDHKDEGVGSQGFWVSTGVDLGLSVAIGLAAAWIGAIAVGVGVFTAPAALIVVALLGIGFSMGLEAKHVPDSVKDITNLFVDDREQEWEWLEGAPRQRVAPKAPPSPLPVQ